MRFKPVLMSLLVAFAASVSADAATPTRSAAVKPPVPLLWKISDADNDLYLLGSFHMLKPTDYPLSADVDMAFDNAESLVFELSPQEMLSPELGISMARAAMRSDGTVLNSALPDATVAQLDAWIAANNTALQKMGVPAQAFQRFEPWFVALTVSNVEMSKVGLDPELGLDMHFMGRANKASKPATGLEKGSEQIAVLDGMSNVEQLQFLNESLGEAENAQVEIDRLHAAWRRGDPQMLLDGMATDMRRDYPQLYRRINVDRNDAWVPKLQRMLDGEAKDDTLVVVGALHLLGDDGVVEKLRAKGYRVKRVCSACEGKNTAP
jgi:uncharacterized protein